MARRFLWSQLRFRPSRVAALALVSLISAVSFTLLTSSVRSSALHVQGTLKSAYRPAYDILVRPPGSQTALERDQRLVRPNYLSGIFGGISLAQWHRIERISGVSVAAPVANLGYILPFANIHFPLDRLVKEDPGAFQLYRVRFSFVGQDGTSHYPSGTGYVYYTRRDRFVYDNHNGIQEVLPGTGSQGSRLLPVCNTAYLNGNPTLHTHGPFGRTSYLNCFSQRSPGQGDDAPILSQGRTPVGKVGIDWQLSFPILVAAIDPVQERRLLHLDRTVVSGRYLRENDGPRLRWNTTHDTRFRFVPVLASTRNFVDEQLEAQVERLHVPAHELPQVMSTTRAYRFMAGLPGATVQRVFVPTATAFRKLGRGPFGIDSALYWTTSAVRYRGDPGKPLAPLTVENPISVWSSPFYPDSGGYYPAPPSNQDVQFRRLAPHSEDNHIPYGVANGASFRIVGRFDPAKLPGFSPLSKVPLETFYPPVLEPADAASRAALHGKPLLPTENVGGYISQPPLLLTTIASLKPFYNPRFYSHVGKQAKAPISVIQVRVAGVKGPDPLSLERIRVVAQKIHDETGLAVDITAGSSPHPLLVRLPKGKFGRPALLLREGWSKKGVSVSFLRALNREDAALFALILLICGFFIANGALASVRARRAEIGVLRTLGWSGRHVFGAILGELALIGLLSGLAGVLISILLVLALSLDLALWWTLLVLPIALAILALGGLGPALVAAAGRPLDALRPPVSARRRGARVRHVSALAWANLRRLPARTLLGAAGLFIGVAALAILIGIQRSFHGSLVGTLLGNAISVQVRGADFVAVGLTIGLAALSVADVLYLNLRERQTEFATLRTVGWSDRQLATIVALEGLGLGGLGSIAGAVTGVLVSTLVFGSAAEPAVVSAAISGGAGIAAAVLASLLPLSQLRRLAPAAALAAE